VVSQAGESLFPEGSPDRTGERLDDRYELVRLLGQGVMGEVYEARHLALDRPVAVKLIRRGGRLTGERSRELFGREIKALSRLHHPHVVGVVDSGTSATGQPYLVTELVRGRTLQELLDEEGPPAPAHALAIFHQVLTAVEEAHRCEVVHGDLKPGNIMLQPLASGEEYVKVLDFGLAVLDDEHPRRLPQPAEPSGTPAYMAPEQLLGEGASVRSDLYALGCLLHELLLGEIPHDAPDVHALLVRRVAGDELPLVGVDGRELPPGFAPLLRQLLARDPAARPGSAAEVRQMLQAALGRARPQRLGCDHCRRPKDPATGLCSLHAARPTGPSAAEGPRPAAEPSLAALPSSGPGPSGASPTAVIRQTLPSGTAELLRRRLHLPGTVSRSRELDVLTRFLLGGAPVLELTGPPGSGRSTLLEALARGGELLGMAVARAGEDPDQAQTPWEPLRQLAVGLFGQPLPRLPWPAEAPASPRAASTPLPEGLDLLCGQLPPPSVLPEREGIGQVGALLRALVQQQGRPTLLLVDDLDRFDRASREVIEGLALGGGEGLGLLKLVLVSEQRLGLPPESHWALAVAGLTAEELQHLAALAARDPGVGPGKTDPGVAPPASSTPFGAWQRLRLRAEGGADPTTEASVLAGRLALLPVEARRALAAVAVFGQQAPLPLVDRLVGDPQLLLALGLLLRRGLLRQPQPEVLAVAHPLLATASLAELAPAARHELHLRAHDAVAAAGGSPFLLARLAAEAGRGEETVHAATRAGDLARQLGADEDAALQHYPQALQAARFQLLRPAADPRVQALARKQVAALWAAGHTLAAERVERELLRPGSAAAAPAGAPG